MKKLLTLVICLLLLATSVVLLVACEKTPDEPVEPALPEGQLATPVIQLASNVIYWSEVENADFYYVYQDGKFIKIVMEPSYSFFFGVNGSHSFYIVARSFNPNYADSEKSNTVTTTVSLLDLVAPDITIEGNVVSWLPSKGATSYEVLVNGNVVSNAKLKVIDGCYYWTSNIVNVGTHRIQVRALSNNIDYEIESDLSNSVVFEVSSQKKWAKSTMLSDWDIFGGVETHSEGICLECASYAKSGLINYCQIDADKSFLHIDFCNTSSAQPAQTASIKVYINGNVLKAVGSTANAQEITGQASLKYDLTQFIGQVVEIKIESTQAKHACISKIAIGTTDNVSPYIDWTTENFIQEWESIGKVENHAEGICLEHEGTDPSISNVIYVDESRPFFVVDLRKFVRVGVEEQDKDPQIYVYVNDNLVRALDSDVDYITATGDASSKYTFDLRAYAGQNVTVKLVSKQGEHACITRMYMSTKGEYSLSTTWDIALIAEEWIPSGKVITHTEGVCLEYIGGPAKIENKVMVNAEASTFAIAFRKFVRTGTQDLDPQVKVYVNGQLVRATDATEDYVVATADTYSVFEYDLSAYVGQVVTITIENSNAPHACFNSLLFK